MPQPTPLVRLCRVVALVVLLLWGTPAGADVIKLTPDDFVGASVIDFTDVPVGTAVNNLAIDGVWFSAGTSGHFSRVFVADHFGTTSYVDGPSVYGDGGSPLSSIGDGRIIMRFPTLQTRLGFGFSVLLRDPRLGAYSFLTLGDPSPDAEFAAVNLAFDPAADWAGHVYGTFVGVESTVPFDLAELDFGSLGDNVLAFAFDNVRYDVPEPVPDPGSTLLLLGLGLAGLRVWKKRLG